MNVPLSDQLRAAERELAMRRRVYPKWVGADRMTEEQMLREIAAMSAVVETLRRLHQSEWTYEAPATSGWYWIRNFRNQVFPCEFDGRHWHHDGETIPSAQMARWGNRWSSRSIVAPSPRIEEVPA